MERTVKGLGSLTAEKKIDIVMALTFIGVIWFRLGIYISMCITNTDMGILTKWVISLFCVAGMIVSLIFFGLSTLLESQGEPGEQDRITRGEYMYFMECSTGCIAGVIGLMTPIYIANIQDMPVLGYTVIPCLIAVIVLHLVYKIKYKEVVGW